MNSDLPNVHQLCLCFNIVPIYWGPDNLEYTTYRTTTWPTTTRTTTTITPSTPTTFHTIPHATPRPYHTTANVYNHTTPQPTPTTTPHHSQRLQGSCGSVSTSSAETGRVGKEESVVVRQSQVPEAIHHWLLTPLHSSQASSKPSQFIRF